VNSLIESDKTNKQYGVDVYLSLHAEAIPQQLATENTSNNTAIILQEGVMESKRGIIPNLFQQAKQQRQHQHLR
jgi:hypothetical protein